MWKHLIKTTEKMERKIKLDNENRNQRETAKKKNNSRKNKIKSSSLIRI